MKREKRIAVQKLPNIKETNEIFITFITNKLTMSINNAFWNFEQYKCCIVSLL
jgi:hypothetical protein